MNVLWRIWKSSVGKKYLMAISGACLVLFAIGHMIGNLQVFLGPHALNRYAHFLQSTGELLWAVRIGLLALVTLHIVSAITLSLENKKARPLDYAHGQPAFGASLASRTMLVGGLIVGAFVVFHLMHYTVRLEAVSLGAGDFRSDVFKETLKDGTVANDVFLMVIAGFKKPLVTLIYAIGVGCLCFHLSHGIGAMFQSLGFKNRVYGPLIDKAAKAIAVVLLAGYLAVPAAVLLGYGNDYHQSRMGQSAPSLIPTIEAQK